MQNNSTGMLATRVPVGVVPNAPRWPSWKIHTSAPNAAVSERTLSTRAFNGSTTLPVSRNSSTNVMTAMTPSTSGSREVIAATLSRLTWAIPVNSTSRPPGPATSCNRVELGLGGIGEQRRIAADRQERAAVGQPRSPRRAVRPCCRRRMCRWVRSPRRHPAPATGRRRTARSPRGSGRSHRARRRSPRCRSCRRSSVRNWSPT